MLKWTNRLFDCVINLMLQTSYNVYRRCRQHKLGNEETLMHREFNERVTDHFLNNIDWKLEKEEAALGKKVLMKRAIAKSNVAQCVDINFSEFHDLALSEVARGKSQKVRPYICAMCKIDPPKELLSYESRTLYYCVQCSVFAEVAKRHQDRTYLHPQCFGRYDRHVYNKLIGSSSVKGIVISK